MRRILVATLMGGALLLAACGSSGSTSGGSGTGSGSGNPEQGGTETSKSSPTSAAGGGVEMTARNLRFDPATMDAKAGSTVDVTLRNTDSVDHNFTLKALGIDEDVAAGQTITVKLSPTKAGAALEFFCKFHVGSGMKGTVNVS